MRFFKNLFDTSFGTTSSYSIVRKRHNLSNQPQYTLKSPGTFAVIVLVPYLKGIYM